MDATELPGPAPSGVPTIRTGALLAGTNPAGDSFGGWLLAQTGLAAGTAAARQARGPCATIAVEAMRILEPGAGDAASPRVRSAPSGPQATMTREGMAGGATCT